jgi:hypothetical protein
VSEAGGAGMLGDGMLGTLARGLVGGSDEGVDS